MARGLCDGALLGALLIVFGTALFDLAFVPAEAAGEEPPGLRLIQRSLGLVLLTLWPLKLLLVVGSMAGTSPIRAIPFVTEVVRDTHYGHDWLAGAPLVLLLAAALWLRNPAMRAWLGFAIGGTLLGIWALSSHAIDFGAAAIAIYFVHELAAALWIGALASFWLFAGGGHLESKVGALMARRVSAAAGWCVAGVLLSGLYSAYKLAGIDPRNLCGTAYGRILLLKVAMFAVIVMIGAYNRYVILPPAGAAPPSRALIRNVAIEAALMLVVFAVAGLLANTPPPR